MINETQTTNPSLLFCMNGFYQGLFTISNNFFKTGTYTPISTISVRY